MRITIAQRLRPFSHEAGAQCLLPFTTLRLEIFPALVRVFDLSKSRPILVAEHPLEIQGPMEDFTVMQDLEHGIVKVYGRTCQGWLRYVCAAAGERSLYCYSEKKPEGFASDFLHDIPQKPNSFADIKERLSLGNHKKGDWELIRRRMDLTEILPIWFSLGQQIPRIECSRGGTLDLLTACESAILANKPETIVPAVTRVVLAGFEGMLSPRLEDSRHQGFNLKSLAAESAASPLALITQGATMIRTLFIRETHDGVELLPSLPPQFHCGRMINVDCKGVGNVDFEWSKKELRRVIVRSAVEGTAIFRTQKDLKSFRLRSREGEKGQRLRCNHPIPLIKGEYYFLDNFEK